MKFCLPPLKGEKKEKSSKATGDKSAFTFSEMHYSVTVAQKTFVWGHGRPKVRKLLHKVIAALCGSTQDTSASYCYVIMNRDLKVPGCIIQERFSHKNMSFSCPTPPRFFPYLSIFHEMVFLSRNVQPSLRSQENIRDNVVPTPHLKKPYLLPLPCAFLSRYVLLKYWTQ